MIDPLRMATSVEIVAAKQKRAPLHRCVKLELEAEGIGELQRAALEWLLGEGAGDALLLEKGGGLVEVGLVADLETQPVAGGRRRLAQHQRMMLMLLAAAQIERFVVAVLDMEADSGFVKLAADARISHVEHNMTAANDVEWWIEDVLRDGHNDSFTSQPGTDRVSA